MSIAEPRTSAAGPRTSGATRDIGANEPVAVLCVSPDTAAQLRRIPSHRCRLIFTDTWEALRAVVADERAAAVALEPLDRHGRSAAGFLEWTRRHHPTLPTAALCDTGPAGARHIVTLAHAGVEEVVLRGVDDLETALIGLSRRADRFRAVAATLPLLSPHVRSPGQPLIAACMALGYRRVSVAEVAHYLDVHRKTLVNRASAAHLPPPSALISWCRLMHAAHALRDARCSVEHAALHLGFGSGTALRSMFRRYTGMRPTEVIGRGGHECVAQHLIAAIGVVRRDRNVRWTSI